MVEFEGLCNSLQEELWIEFGLPASCRLFFFFSNILEQLFPTLLKSACLQGVQSHTEVTSHLFSLELGPIFGNGGSDILFFLKFSNDSNM